MGLSLLFGSVPGPWLTLAFPAAAVFALYDRRPLPRIAAALVLVALGALMLPSAAGALLFGVALAAVGTAGLAVGRLGIPATLGGLALPVLGGAAAAIGLAAALLPEAWAAWEAALEQAVTRGAGQALDRYRAFGMDPATIEALEGIAAGAGAWVGRIWPALVAGTLWLGIWLAHRLLARWGRVAPAVEERLERQPFARFRLPDPAVWLLLGGLGALWLPGAVFERAGINVVILLGLLYALTGLAIMGWWLEQRGLGPWARVLLPAVFVLFVPPAALVGWTLIGLADVWLGLRERSEADAAPES
ncbi:MAG: DUF2232 domain-containing protein [Gemmatimonadota bacterium]